MTDATGRERQRLEAFFSILDGGDLPYGGLVTEAHDALRSLLSALEAAEADAARAQQEEDLWRVKASDEQHRREAAEADARRYGRALEEIGSTDFTEPSDWSELGRIARAALAGRA